MGGPPPPPAAKKKGGNGAIIGAAVGGLVLIGGGIAAYMMFFKGESVFPCDLGNLPADTEGVSRRIDTGGKEVGLSTKDIPEQARWSAYAQRLCAGEDVFDMAQDATDPDSAKRKGAQIAGLNAKDAQKYLACGKAFAEKEKSTAVYSVDLGKESVRIVLNGLEEYPGSTKKVKDGKDIDKLTAIKCVVGGGGEDFGKPPEEKADEKPECPKEGGSYFARVADTNMWVGGSKKSLETFAEGYSADGSKGLKDKDKEGFDAVAGKVAKHDSVQVGKGEATVASGIFGSATKSDREDQGKVMKDLKDYEVYYALGSSMSEKGGSTVLYMKAKDDKKAEEIVEKLEKLYKFHKAGIKEDEEEQKKSEEELEKALKDMKDEDKPKEDKVRKAFTKARRAMESRAYKDNVKIEASGDMVIVTVEYKAEDDDTEAFKAYGEKTKEKLEACAEFVDALADGKEPGDGVLKKLGGDDLVKAVKEARDGGGAKKEE